MWQYVKNLFHLLVAWIACVYYQFPCKNLTVIGVTGTDGKTTTAHIIYHILQKAGHNVSLITSVGAIINGKTYDTGFHVTTPSSFSIQKFLSTAVKTPLVKGRRFMILETTSHSLDQHRVYGIGFEVAVLTNVTHEHLDYHKTHMKYLFAKLKLLRSAKKAVVNKDDDSYKILAHNKWITYGMKDDADINPRNFPFTTSLIGTFNKYNCLAAIGVCKALEISDLEIRSGLKTVQPPKGREEIIYQKDFTVMIDFAHTPNALTQVLSSVKQQGYHQIIHVFGSAGKRDASKRPLMGVASGKYADVIILTAEDPRGESVEKISAEIREGIKNVAKKEQNSTLLQISDRQEAIRQAIVMAKKGDMVIITGKGHERSMNFGKGEVKWSDHDAVGLALEERDQI